MAPVTRPASRRTIADDIRWFIYRAIPSVMMTILVVYITLTFVFTLNNHQPFPVAAAIAMTALFGACLVLFAGGALVLRFSACAVGAGIADAEDGNNTDVARISTSVDDTAVQPPPPAGLPPVQIQPNVAAPAPGPLVHEAQGSPLEGHWEEHVRQDMMRMLHDINIEQEIPLPPRPTRTNPRQTPYAQRSEREAPAENPPLNRQVGGRPSIINSPGGGQSPLAPPRRHPGRLSTDTERRIPSPIPEHPAEHDSNGRGNQRYSMPQGPNDLWPRERRDGTFSRAGNRPTDETRSGQTSNAQRPPTPLVNPHDQNPSVNLAQLDHDHQDAQERMALVLSLFDVKDPQGFLHHLEAMARKIPRRSSPGATELEQDNASDTSDGSVYSRSCGFSRWRGESRPTDVSEEDVEGLNCFNGFEPSVYSDSSNSSRARSFTRPSSPRDSDHSGGLDTRFDNRHNPRRQNNKDYHYACPSTAVADRLIDLLDRMFDLLDAKARSDQAPSAMGEEEPYVFEGIGTGEAYRQAGPAFGEAYPHAKSALFTGDQSKKVDHHPAASSLSPRVVDAIARYLERYPATRIETAEKEEEDPMVFLRRSCVWQPVSRFLRETGWVLVWKGGYWETNERVIELDEDEVEVEVMDEDVEVEMMDEECDHEEGGDDESNGDGMVLSEEVEYEEA
ncbi:hypothetical protein GE09DRAFT_1063969 [Coniochaeta sp. 2T2.1]|nr:hypothetical protein GE09DRAFT_1063969 [Coniochaeta sp. 2T2.1]